MPTDFEQLWSVFAISGLVSSRMKKINEPDSFMTIYVLALCLLSSGLHSIALCFYARSEGQLEISPAKSGDGCHGRDRKKRAMSK